MLNDSIQLISGAEISRHIVDDNARGTTLPLSGADGDEFQLTQADGNNGKGIYVYVAAESKWVVKYPNGDILPYDIGGSTIGSVANNAVIGRHLAVRSFKLKTGFENCKALAISAPAVDTTFSIIKINRLGSQINVGSMFFATGETVGIFTQVGSGDILFSAGEAIIVKAPVSVDQFISDIAFTFAGTLV